MQLQIDENEQAHIYSCLLVGNQEFGKIKKTLAKLNREDASIDHEIALNAKLRREFNPRAEDEARERSRKNDPAQLDITDAVSSGETGGGNGTGETFSLTTPDTMTDDDLRDALLAIGLVVSLADIGTFESAEFAAVAEWVGHVVAANTIGGTIPDEPEVLALNSTSVARLVELLACGPYVVVEEIDEDSTPFFEVQDSTYTGDDDEAALDSQHDDRLDAELRAARLNLNALRTSHMSTDDVDRWADAGPWSASEHPMGWAIVAGKEREECDSMEDARGRAARYNRQIAERGDGSAPEHSSDDAAKEIVTLAGRAD